MKSRLQEIEKVPVIIILKDKTYLEILSIENQIHFLKNNAFETQKGLVSFLEEEKIKGNADRINPFWIVNAIALKASPQLIEKLGKRDDIELIQLDHQFNTVEDDLYTTSTVLNNPTSDLIKINTPEPWGYGIYGGGINVSIIDTGINSSHPDIAGRVTRFKDDVYHPDDPYPDPYDNDGHGTHVAGTVGGNGTGGITTGVAPNVSLFGVQVFDGNIAFESTIINGIQWSIENNANIISMSLASSNTWTTPDCDLDDPAMANAINNAIASGVIVVAAAGNDQRGVSSPGCIKNVTAVGAVGSNDVIAYFSGRGGAMMDHGVVAPGVGITSLDYLTTGYISYSGTSMATPHVAGTYALMLEAAKRKGVVLEPMEARSILRGTSKDLGTVGIDNTYGAGRIDAFEAIKEFMMGYVNGTVVDSVTQQGIPGAIVTTNTSIMTTTNGTGYYSLDLLEGAYELTVSDDPEYYTNSSVIVRATNDPALMQDIEIEKKPRGNITGRIQNTAAD
ncbi:MAG: S8 family serine peptidase [Candidatus Methanoperedens sp.]|nr:S8 family serine peptidase [Candidatus Methanoperedens sp.]